MYPCSVKNLDQRGQKFSVLFPKHFKICRSWEWLTWGFAIIYARKFVFCLFLVKLKTSTLNFIEKDSFFQGIFWRWFFVTFFQTFLAWGVPISLGFSAIVQHMDSSVSILESASFASLENMIGSLVLGWQL